MLCKRLLALINSVGRHAAAAIDLLAGDVLGRAQTASNSSVNSALLNAKHSLRITRSVLDASDCFIKRIKIANEICIYAVRS